MVTSIFQPDIEAMRQHVEHLFGGFLDGCHEGKVELSWTNTTADEQGRYRLSNARLYGTDELEELITEAARLNATPMCNVYIGAALRHPDTPPFGRAQDRDAWALTCAYVDLDDPGAAGAAKSIYGLDKPTFIVLTGREPHVRAQLWWRLEEPITNPEWWPALLRGMAKAMKADRSVTNPSRVMRLAGSIAWPVKEGRTVELTAIAPLREPGAAYYAVEHLARQFPPIGADSAPAAAVAASYTTNSLGLADKISDGREGYMRNTISACLIEYIGSHGATPTPHELFAVAWPQYERKVDLTRAGRGADEFLAKCGYTIQRFERGDIRGIETLDKAIEVYRRKQVSRPAQAAQPRPEVAAPADDIFETLSIEETVNAPPLTWLIDGMILEHGLSFVYGKPGKGKSFLSLDMALRVAYGLDWHGRECKQGGVLYIAGEGKGGYRNRMRGWHLHHGIEPNGKAFRLLPRAVNFMQPEEVAKLVRTVKATVGDAKLVVIDTVARSLPGAEENASKEMGLFVAACDAIKTECGVCVIGIHHSGKDEDRGMRGSTALEGAGDCVLHLKRNDDSKIIEVVTEKQKEGEELPPVHLRLLKVEWLDGLKQESTLVPEVASAAPEKSALDKPACRKILNEIERAWVAGKPWSNAPQTKRDGRYLPFFMSKNTGCSLREAEQMIADWLANDVLSIEAVGQKLKVKGLRVIGSID